MWRRLQRR
jgi:hypothetical protein